MKVEKWLHISEMGGDPWILPIYTALNDAIDQGKLAQPSKEFNELGLYISIRLNMLPRIINRINKEFGLLLKNTELTEESYVYTKDKEGSALEIDNDLKYHLLIDIDSFIFELNSCCDLMLDFLFQTYILIGRKIEREEIGRELRKIIEKEGSNADWFIELDTHRNTLIHKIAPYIAIDISNGLQFADLIIMKENLKLFDDQKKFIRLSDLDRIVHGFLNARVILQSHLIEDIKKLNNK